MILFDDAQNCVNHILDIAIAHAQIQRQRDEPLILPVRHGEIVGAIAVLIAIIRMQMDGDEMDAGADVARLEFLDERARSIMRRSRFKRSA